jgi:chondroitin AC lyase
MTSMKIRLLFLIVFAFFAQPASLYADTRVPADDLELIRKRIVDDLLEAPVNIDEIRKLVSTLRPDGTWPGIDYKDVSRTGFQHKDHLQNMFEMSRAFRRPGSALKDNQELKKAIGLALDYWIANDFICDNWWWNEMGTPNLMINILLLMDGDLTEKQRTEGIRIAGRANLHGVGARPGGDLIAIAAMLGKQALFTHNEKVLDTVVNTMASEIKVTTGRGLQPDMSFHHRVDNVISTLTYGTNYLSSFAYWAVKIQGTKYKLPDSAARLLIDYYIDGISQSMIYRKYPDPGAENRDLTRKAALNLQGVTLPENLMKISTYRSKELEEIIRVRKGLVKANFTKDRFFWHSSYLTHQRPDYFASVRMHSSRANNMEEPHNEEGILNHHFGDGSSFISISGREYVDVFPVWDWQKIPGTTVVQKPELPNWKQIAKKGLTDFSGAVTDGIYTAGAFDFVSVHDPLRARKSWFFFDKEYVCLGTAIQSGSEYPVYTTLNQCLLNTDVIAGTAAGQQTLKKGTHALEDVSWILQDKVAYIFPVSTAVKISNQKATGNWRRINHQAWATEEPVEKEIFTAWIDHGKKPDNEGYAYIVLPNSTATVAGAYSRNPQVEIVSNTSEIQAVHHKGLGISQIVFYEPAEILVPGNISIAAASPCMAMITAKAGKITAIAVSDPTQKLKTIELKISGKFKIQDPKVQSRSENNITTLNIELPSEGYAGKSVVLKTLQR